MPTPTVVSAFRTGINELNINSKCKTPSLWSDTSLAFRGKDPLLCEGGGMSEGISPIVAKLAHPFVTAKDTRILKFVAKFLESRLAGWREVTHYFGPSR